MGTLKDLDHSEAISKLKELAEDINICMFCTNVKDLPFATRPMSTAEVDEDGNFWFMSKADSNKNFEIGEDRTVQLIYAKASDSHFMSVVGQAKIVRDREKTEELWNIFAKAWFQEGKDDPSLTLIKVTPTDAYYWDTTDGKFISLLKIATSALTGKRMDGGIEGKINV